MLKRKLQEEQRQKALKEKYGVEEEKTVIVEKKNIVTGTVRAVLSFTLALLQKAALIAVFILALIGIAALVYPEVRSELISVFGKTIAEFKGYLNF